MLEQTPEERVFIRKLEWDNKVMRVKDYINKQMLEMDHNVAPEQFGFYRPNIKGVSEKEFQQIFAELQKSGFIDSLMAVDQNLPDNASEVLPDSIGQIQKVVSNTTRDRASYWDVV